MAWSKCDMTNLKFLVDKNLTWAEKGLLAFSASLPPVARESMMDVLPRVSLEGKHELSILVTGLQARGMMPGCPPVAAVPPEPSKFDRFWAAWPKTRKTGKGAAEKSWKKMGCEAIADKIMLSVEAHKKSIQWTKDNAAYVPLPATWLNQKRWEDEVQVKRNNHNI